MLIYVDSQGVVLHNGGEAHIELEYDDETDRFIATANCDFFADLYRDFMAKEYPKDNPEKYIKECEDICNEISGNTYITLRHINYVLSENCNPSDYYEFTWEYDDGTPVE